MAKAKFNYRVAFSQGYVQDVITSDRDLKTIASLAKAMILKRKTSPVRLGHVKDIIEIPRKVTVRTTQAARKATKRYGYGDRCLEAASGITTEGHFSNYYTCKQELPCPIHGPKEGSTSETIPKSGRSRKRAPQGSSQESSGDKRSRAKSRGKR